MEVVTTSAIRHHTSEDIKYKMYRDTVVYDYVRFAFENLNDHI